MSSTRCHLHWTWIPPLPYEFEYTHLMLRERLHTARILHYKSYQLNRRCTVVDMRRVRLPVALVVAAWRAGACL